MKTYYNLILCKDNNPCPWTNVLRLISTGCYYHRKFHQKEQGSLSFPCLFCFRLGVDLAQRPKWKRTVINRKQTRNELV